ncbi:MAG TPA: hybrid sensor histidine kinase/response regulator [Gemmataceae bacterium]|jgi:two-component system sensor histidine kinase and response regulator WspE
MSDSSFSMMDLFREEVRAHSAGLSEGLLRLESEPADAQHLEPLMRAAHSIKGAARIVGIDLAVQLAHVMEDVFVAAQHGKVRLSPADIDLLLSGTDILAELGKLTDENASNWSTEQEAPVGKLTTEMRAILTRPEAVPPTGETPVTPKEQHPVGGTGVSPVQKTPIPPEDKSPTGGTGISPVQQTKEVDRPLPPTPSSSAAGESVVRVTAHSLTRLMGLAGEALVQSRWLQPFMTSLLKLKKNQDHLAAVLEDLASALRSGSPDQVAGLSAETQRQFALSRQGLAQRIGEFEDHAARAEDLNTRLYFEVIGSRMRPFADGVQGFPRMVRDLARSLEKQVRLEIIGKDTKVDRDILDKLEAPLTHLLRNAIDHGLETPTERRAAGKPECGVLRLEGRHRAGMLIITVEDDGRGIDLERLRSKILERGLSRPDLVSAMSEAELLSFLFLPGFSTASSVTEVSGRGVGLDVVHDMAGRVGGSVHVTSRLGRGTAFHLQLPITLSVIRAVIVDIGGEPFAFPHNRIDRLLRVPRAGLDSLENRQFVDVDGRNVGIVLATQLFDLPSVTPKSNDDLPVLLVSDAAGQYGLIVDGIRGEQDLVVRPLDPRLGKVPSVSALAILDDGAPALIADVEDLMRSMDHLIQTGTLRRCESVQTGEKRSKRILVVEDSITVREVERQILRQYGYDVAVAVDGQEGWNVARTEPFDLIVTDVDMPRMNGLDLIRAVRSHAALHDVPIIVVSYKDRPEDRLSGLEVGANHYLIKSSFHDNTFLQAVVDLIGEP